MHETRRMSHMLHVNAEQKKPLDWWVSLAPLRVLSASPRSVSRSTVNNHYHWSLWDKIKIQGESNWTLENFLNHLQMRYGLNATLIVQGTKMVYVEIMPNHQLRKPKL